MTNRFHGRRQENLGRARQALGLLVLAWVASALTHSQADGAEQAWEFAPYRVRVLVAASPAAGLSRRSEANLCREIQWQAEITDLAVWDVQAWPVPLPLHYELIHSFDSPSLDLISGLDLVVIAKKGQHPDLRLKKLDFVLGIQAADSRKGVIKKTSTEQLRIGICDPRNTTVGNRSRLLLLRHWLEQSESAETASLDAISAKAASPQQLIEQVRGDGLDLALVRRMDLGPNADDFDVAAVDEVLRQDKLFLVVADSYQGRYRVRARELDCRGQIWGPVAQRETDQVEALPWLAYQAVETSFAPVVRIEDAHDGATATTRLRAGGLIAPENSADSPAWLEVGAVLRPVIRRNDRLGNVLENGIEIVPWTYLQVIAQEGVRLECSIHSAYASPVGGRRSHRVERTALRVRPTGTATELRLVARDESAEPLPNYEIHESVSDGKSPLLGKTDWRGSITIPRGDQPIRVLYVKNGQQLLARLPIVPGLTSVETAEAADDAHRLWAEGRIHALRSSFLDLVARRQVLARRVRLEIADGEFNTARQLANELAETPVRDQFRLDVEDVAQDVAVADPRVQAKIDMLLNDIRGSLANYLDPNLARILTREVENARQQQQEQQPVE